MLSASDVFRAAVRGKKGQVRKRRPNLRDGTVTAAKASLWRPKLSACVDLCSGGAKILVVLLLLGTIGFAADSSATHHSSRVVYERRSRRPRDQQHQLQHHLSHHPRDFNVTKSAL